MERTERFLDEQTLKILNYESTFPEVFEVTNSQLGENLDLGKGFIEYVMSNIFPDLREQGDFNDLYTNYVHKQEATAILDATRLYLNNIDKSYLQTIKGQYIVFNDFNQFLSGQENAFGKLVMEIANSGEPIYINKADVLYDIYLAGMALQSLYLNHIGPSINNYLNNPKFESCKTYSDVYNYVMEIDPSTKINVLPKNLFLIKPDQWVLDEFNHQDNDVGLLRRVYNSIEDQIKQKYMNRYIVSKFKTFVEEVISKCPAQYKDVYRAEMDTMFSGNEKHVIEAGYKYNAIKHGVQANHTESLLREIDAIDFRPMKISITAVPTITLERENTSPELQFLSFTAHIGPMAYTKLINNLGFMATSNVFHDLVVEYGDANRGHFSNLFAANILAIITAFKNEMSFLDKCIVFADTAEFFGGQYNFVGKAIETTFNNSQLLKSQLSPPSPGSSNGYNAPSPFYDPHSPVMPGRSPSVSPSVSPTRGIPLYVPDSPSYIPSPKSPQPLYVPLSPQIVKDILLRVGSRGKFEHSVNSTNISPRTFTIRIPENIDPRISEWVNDRFNEFVATYVYIYNNFLTPVNFNLETFYRHVYKPYINGFNSWFINKRRTFVTGAMSRFKREDSDLVYMTQLKTTNENIQALSKQFSPNNSISKLFLELLLTNIVIFVEGTTINVDKFIEYQTVGRLTLSDTDNLDSKFKSSNANILKNLEKYFSTINAKPIVPIVFSINLHDSENLDYKQINRINFWATQTKSQSQSQYDTLVGLLKDESYNLTQSANQRVKEFIDILSSPNTVIYGYLGEAADEYKGKGIYPDKTEYVLKELFDLLSSRARDTNLKVITEHDINQIVMNDPDMAITFNMRNKDDL